MLMSSSEIESFPESHLFDRGFGAGKRAWLNRTLGGLYVWLALARWAREARRLGYPAVRILPSWSRRTMVRRAIRAFDRLTLRAGKSVWVEKTPGHLHFLDRIESLVPDALFIHLVRDGRATVASLVRAARERPEAWRWAGSVDACIDRWNRCIAVTAARAGSPRHHVVRYETLVAAPEAELRRLCDVLGVAYEDAMLHRYAESAARVVRSAETWKAGTGGALSDPGLEKFVRTFDPATRRRIEDALDLARLRSLPDPAAAG
jgi:hypothetical protein